MCRAFSAYSGCDMSAPWRDAVPTLVNFALGGRRISRGDAAAIARTAADGRAHFVWHLDDALLISLPADDEPVLRLPVADAVDVNVRAATFDALARQGRECADDTVRFRWEALTPTTFHHRGRDFPAPDVAAFLGSLAEHWDEVAGGVTAIDPAAVAAVGRQATVTALTGRTVEVAIGADGETAGFGRECARHATATGFTGSVEARIERRRAEGVFAEVITLLHAAAFLGAGSHRGHGMGGTSVTLLEAGRRR